jgi:hypothetical protein
MLQQDQIRARPDLPETRALVRKPQGIVAAAAFELREQAHARGTRPPQDEASYDRINSACHDAAGKDK